MCRNICVYVCVFCVCVHVILCISASLYHCTCVWIKINRYISVNAIIFNYHRFRLTDDRNSENGFHSDTVSVKWKPSNLYVCLSLCSLCICVYIYVSLSASVCLSHARRVFAASIHPSIIPPWTTHPSIYLCIILSTNQSINLYIFPLNYQLIQTAILPSVHPLIHSSIHSFVH